MTPFKSRFISAGGNRHPSAADWDKDTGVLAFGAGRNIALWRPLDRGYVGIETLLSGHSDAVTAIKFAPSLENGQKILLSGSSDTTVKIWAVDCTEDSVECRLIQTLTGHEKSINALTVAACGKYFASAAADATVKVWRLNKEDFSISLSQSINIVPKFFPLALAFARLDSSGSLILAVGGTKAIIQVYVTAGDKLDFQLGPTLAGHEGWIRSLDFVNDRQDLLLASASQDKYIRLWRVHKGEELPTVTVLSDPALGSVGKSLSNKAHRFNVNSENFTIKFEALLLGHEDWIYTAKWATSDGKITLLSSSADNSLDMWQLDESSGVWVCTVRLGEISAQKGSTTATGSTGGFWIGLWSPDRTAVVSLGRTGSWRLWQHQSDTGRWVQHVGISGHTREVQSLAWSKDGTYLLSTSSDQTTRMYSEWRRDRLITWHEVSRPQIHGYDLNCIDSLTKDRFVSGADEKLLRVFDKPAAVASAHSRLHGEIMEETSDLPRTATIPVLGLSNKAEDSSNEALANNTVATDDATEPAHAVTEPGLQMIKGRDHPPTEDQLSRHLLWPEIEKLYGHGYEISAVAASNNGKLVATACKASSLDHALIRIYNTNDWMEIKPSLSAHTLTVTSLSFSPDNEYLLSVGRDRQCCVFRRDTSELSQYKLLHANPKAHTRMILDAGWISNEDRRIFVTAGRDKNIHVWDIAGDSLERRATLGLGAAVTTVAALPEKQSGCHVIACGTENGSISLVQLESTSLRFDECICRLPDRLSPALTATRLAWRPRLTHATPNGTFSNSSSQNIFELAVASEDCSMRIIAVDVSLLTPQNG